VRFEHLNPSGISQFIEIVTQSFDYLSCSMWQRISERLLLSVSPPSSNSRTLDPDWIIRRLTAECKRNVCDAGLVSVSVAHTNKTVYGADLNGGHPKTVFDLDSKIGWYDSRRHPTWLQIDFHPRRLHVSSYCITFGHGCVNSTLQWRLEGSQDGTLWTVIDDRSSETTKRNDFAVCTFECNGNCRDSFRYLRIIKTDGCWGNWYCLGMASLDFCGRLES
jgi:hypothetical protein